MLDVIAKIFSGSEYPDIPKSPNLTQMNYHAANSTNPALAAEIITIEKQQVSSPEEAILLLLYKHCCIYNGEDSSSNWIAGVTSMYPEIIVLPVSDFEKRWCEQDWSSSLITEHYSEPINEDIQWFLAHGDFFTNDLLSEILFSDQVTFAAKIFDSHYEKLYLGETKNRYFFAYNALVD